MCNELLLGVSEHELDYPFEENWQENQKTLENEPMRSLEELLKAETTFESSTLSDFQRETWKKKKNLEF